MMRNGNEKSTSSSLDFDVALGLSTETNSSSCKRAASAMAFSNYYNNSNNSNTSTSSNNPNGFPGGDGGGGTMLNHVAPGGGLVLGDANIYEDHHHHHQAAAVTHDTVLPMSFLNNTTTGFRPPSGGGAGMYGKFLPTEYFSASQWQELERQKIIHKYMMASMPVPPQLILPPPTTPNAAVVSQSPSAGLELRFPTSGSDPEPWRCKRTDGKKWRCSRDVAPDQKYCERHAHKSRTRSRKPVELSSHNKFYSSHTNNNNNKTSTCNAAAAAATVTSSHSHSHSHTLLQRPTTTTTCSLFPTIASASAATSYNDQTRPIEWFLRGGSNANQQQQWQQQVIPAPPSTTLDFTRDMTNAADHGHNPNASSSVYDPYIPDTNFNNSHTTRHFIDAWEKEGGLDDISNKNSNKKFSPSSLLSLSMFGNGIDEENGNDYLGIGMLKNPSTSDKDSDAVIMKQQPAPWMNMNSVSWMNNSSVEMSPPGGPLGEALCLGNSGTMRGNLALSPRHGYSQNNSNNTTNSSTCSKSSCEDGNHQHALNFIG